MKRAGSAKLDPAQWLEGALHLLSLRLRHEVALTRALRGEGRREQFLGLFMSDDEAEAMLDEMSGRLAAHGSGLPALEEVVKAWHDHAARRCADPESIWARLAQSFDLAEAELDLLVLAAAPALDPRFGRVYAYLGDDLTRRFLTPALAQRLLPHQIDALTLRRLLAPSAPLRLYALLSVEPALPRIEAALRSDENLIDLLLGQPVAPPGPWLTLGQGGAPGAVVVAGGGADAVSTAVLDTATSRGWSLCILPDDCSPAMLPTHIRDATLAGATPVIREPALDDAGRAELAPLLAQSAILIAEEAGPWLDAGLDAVHVYPVPDAARHEAWKAHLLGPGTSTLAHARHLDLLHLARMLQWTRDPGTLSRAAEAQASAGMTRCAHRLETRQTLDDLVVPQTTRVALERLVGWAGQGTQVLDEWGFGALFNKGHGAVALFKGPSGTGKTMAAAIVGAALDLPVFRVDLAAMVSKYIGETEKNLEQLFQAAEGSDALLFFDEADALFGQRSEVNDAHDRYANLETSYLLQRLESFGGLSVLATNLAQNMDPAFLRRFDHVIDFPVPTATHRRALWERGRQSRAPIKAEIDFAMLAERFELTGAEIRNCWLDAAYRAAARGGEIGMDELMQAVATELLKQGKVLKKSDFGDHYGKARGGGG
uniref:ATP-binding protein n=1 Tax=uncultured Halomonas sp. TaxID=173971 RepID=UPI00260308CB|nr:ATP-binding protein [uncultured Halomonas sp.]